MLKQIVIKSAQDIVVIRPQDVERDDIELTVTFDQVFLETLLNAYDLIDFSQLSAHITIAAWRKEGLYISGDIKADYTQKCVVTLQPLHKTQTIDIKQKFLPAVPHEPGQEIEVDISEDTPYEFENDSLDLTAFILESFALELDLYPRSPDAELEKKYQPDTDTTADKKPSPFAVLKNLKESN